MKIDLTFNYKSLSPFVWDNIPKFSILTGVNGTGKTQLLELIHYMYSTSRKISDEDVLKNSHIIRAGSVHRRFMNTQSTGETWDFNISSHFFVDEVIFLKSEWKLNKSKLLNEESLQKIKFDLYKSFLAYNESDLESNNPRLHQVFNHVRTVLGKPIAKILYDEFINKISDFFYYGQEDLTQEISIIFYEYYLNHIKSNLEPYDFFQQYGPPPWNKLNNLLNELHLSFECSYPKENNYSDDFEFTIRNTTTGLTVNFDELSLGESILVSIAFYIFISERKGISIKLLLLDEPDAHLHPSMVNDFLRVIYEILVKKYNIRIILSTHSASTVALAPEEYDCGIFEMHSNPSQIIKVSREQAIASLTSGLIVVTPYTKTVLVEGKDDEPFYYTIYKQLQDYRLLPKTVSIHFKRYGDHTNKDTVYFWIKGLLELGLRNDFKGIIDKDNGNPASENIFILERYSIENYLLDPIVVFATSRQLLKELSEFKISIGEEYKIKTLDNSTLQIIANRILNIVEPNVLASEKFSITADKKKLIEISFINGFKLKYPAWLFTERGKDLRKIFQDTFDGPSLINNQHLIVSLKRTSMIPLDLHTLFIQIAK